MMKRNDSLDALRGYAIFTMILSGSIAYGDALPAWMYHAQVPPPLHKFNPALPGITWVDLVFPFFLFCMGAAIPLSLNKYSSHGGNTFKVILIGVRRFLLLAFFSLFCEQMKAWVISPNPGNKEHLFSLLGFVLLFFSFTRFPGNMPKRTSQLINYASLALAIACLFLLPLNDGKGFQKNKTDIIIMVLANMALFGTICWWCTRNKPLLRLGILPFIMGVFLASQEPGSWNAAIFNWSPEPALYTFYFLKYLFIILPATFAGEWILKYSNENRDKLQKSSDSFLIAMISVLLVATNVYFLFNRQLLANLLVTAILLLLFQYFITKRVEKDRLYSILFSAGAYCLLLGLCFEAYEDGIKKDRSTYSYYFVTSGLAFFMLFLFGWLSGNKWLKWLNDFFSATGKNPMLAYVGGSLLLIPLLQLSGLHAYWNEMNYGWMGFLKGLLFTITVCAIAIFFTRKGWIWKT